MAYTLSNILYGPGLRLKEGELGGLFSLGKDVADRVAPRLIVPPKAEQEETDQRLLFESESVPALGSILSKYWQKRPAFIDVRYLTAEFEPERVHDWLPRMFHSARSQEVVGIPVATLAQLKGEQMGAFQASLSDNTSSRIAFCINSTDFIDTPTLRDDLHRAVDELGLSPSECTIFLDFSDADLSLPEAVEGVIRGAFEDLQDMGLWSQLIFQGTNYPEKNPALPDDRALVARSEWKAWKQAIRYSASTQEFMVFGDYAADCAKMNFKKGGARPIGHYRYATEDNWLVQRVADGVSLEAGMREVCKNIVGSKYFAGPDFSSADEFIYLCAHGQNGVGNATTWRAINTTHHITQVVSDLGKVKNISLMKRAVRRPLVQSQLAFESPTGR